MQMAANNFRAMTAVLFDPHRPWKEQQPEQLPPAPADLGFVRDWSPDGRCIAEDGPRGIGVYRLDTKSYEVLTADGGQSPHWLADNRRLLYTVGNRLMLIDSVTKRTREILALEPDTGLSAGIARDGSRIFLRRETWDSDIWLATIKP